MFSIIFMVLFLWFFFKLIGKASSQEGKSIVLELDYMYFNNKKMTIAVLEKLKEQGRTCEIIKLSSIFSQIKVDGKLYTVSGRFDYSQIVILRPIKYE